MKHPPYHLRPNKAIDRFMFIESIRCIGGHNKLQEYTYYGFGGPYLEDLRLVHEHFPEIRMVSIERDEETYKRQRFHLPCGHIRLRRESFHSFLAHFNAGDLKSIFWLDYTELNYRLFGEFKTLLGMVSTGSLIKITLRVETGDYLEAEQVDKFGEEFQSVLPEAASRPPQNFGQFASLAQEMLQVAAEQQLPSATGLIFQPISSFCYKDTVGILTLTGVVCQRSEQKDYQERFAHLRFANLTWKKPRIIDVPFLSTKERMHLQRHLPCALDAGPRLLKALGYNIDGDRTRALAKMRQYSEFYRYYPHFIRAIP